MATWRLLNQEEDEEEEEVVERKKSRKTATSTTFNIPHEIIIDILSRVPVESLLRFKRVCKLWYNLIENDSSFIKLHIDHSIKLRQYALMIPYYNDMYSVDVPNAYRPWSDNAVSLDYPFRTDSSAVNILGSCNGIFLIGIYDQYVGQWNPFRGNQLVYSYLCLWNPSTKQYKKLPTTLFEIPKDRRRNQYCKIVFGFGYDSSTDDYKVVRIFYDYYQTTLLYLESEVHVYSMRRNTCKRIQDMPSLPIHMKLLVYIEYGIYARGVIHWLAKPTVATDGRFSSVPIVSFDVTSEKFSEVQMPYFDYTFDLMSFGVLDECLCVYVRCDDMHVDGFMMKEYGVKESWTKIFSVGLSSNSYTRFKALWFTKNGDLYLQTCPTNDYLILYEPEKERMVRLELCGLPTTYPQHVKVEPYIRSLVSLKLSGMKDGRV